MPPNASVIIFDDNADLRKTLREYLQSGGHIVIGEAGSINELERFLAHLKQGTLPTEPVVATLDNNAPWDDGEAPDPRGVGRAAERKIKAAIEKVTTIATTTAGSEKVGYGDYRFNPEAGMEGLSGFIDALPAKER
ncbi:hypothetical protein HY339_00730 [Candidatus Gottesmanbacteria bacterium]|nr:hypothetical protein [Candidatus Gottesmanbacteria bacterium]